MKPNFDKLPNLLYEITAALRNEFDRRLKPLGLSQAKWRTLLCLSKAEKPLTQTELASKIGIENATLVGLLDRLSKMGWVKRLNSSTDRRSKIVALTKKSKKTLQTLHNTVNQLRHEIFKIVKQKELNVCINLLERIKNHIEATR